MAERSGQNRCIYISGYSDYLNHAYIDEYSQHLTIRLIQANKRSSADNSAGQKGFDSKKENEISDYFYHIGCLAIRFEGPAIIHPFHYFW